MCPPGEAGSPGWPGRSGRRGAGCRPGVPGEPASSPEAWKSYPPLGSLQKEAQAEGPGRFYPASAPVSPLFPANTEFPGGRAGPPDRANLEDARSGPSDRGGRPGARDAPVARTQSSWGRPASPPRAPPPAPASAFGVSPNPAQTREAAACLIHDGYLYFRVIGARLRFD